MVLKNSATPISFTCHDPQGGRIAIQFISGLEHGKISGHPNPIRYMPITEFGVLRATYTPDAGYSGGDSLTFRAVKIFMPDCPGGLVCTQAMQEVYSNEATVAITVLPAGNAVQQYLQLVKSCGNGGVKKLVGKLKRSRKRYKALKRKYKRYSRRATNVRSSKLRRRYRSKAKRVRKSYRKTNKRSKRLRKKIISCRAAGY